MKSAELLTRLAKGEFHFAGVEVEDTLDLSGLELGDVCFSYAIFQCDVKAVGTKFRSLKMDYSEIRGVANFNKATFSEGSNFQHMVAFGNFSLEDTLFTQEATFRGAHFYGGLWVNSSQFHGYASFKDVEVHGRTHIMNTDVDASKITSFGISTLHPHA
jgi:uncharacterized protein YjbI with pentapeptide repeats